MRSKVKKVTIVEGATLEVNAQELNLLIRGMKMLSASARNNFDVYDRNHRCQSPDRAVNEKRANLSMEYHKVNKLFEELEMLGSKLETEEGNSKC